MVSRIFIPVTWGKIRYCQKFYEKRRRCETTVPNPEGIRDFGITGKFSVVSKRIFYNLELKKSGFLFFL